MLLSQSAFGDPEAFGALAVIRIHRISVASSPDVLSDLEMIGVSPVGSSLATFEISETDDRWPLVREWVTRHGAVDVSRAEYSQSELEACSWLELLPDWHHGYPQPNDDEFGFLAATYDLTSYCSSCGVGLKQNSPFRMTDEPRWGLHGIMQLNWVFDEYFVTPEVWTSIFKPNGVGFRSVLGQRGVELGSVVQLDVADECTLSRTGLTGERCPECLRTRFRPVTTEPLVLCGPPASRIARTSECFGSGSSASRSIIVSQSIARAVWAGRIRGVTFKPVLGD